jgi:membrane associated rhomboid family serine protease
VFGPALEHRFGPVSYASLYVACGLGGSALYQAVGRDAPAVGASGAIFGLMGALLATVYRQRFSPAGRAMFSQLLLLLGINLAIPFVVPNVAWEAHVGGLIAGVVIAVAWERLPISGAASAGRRVAVAVAVAAVAMVVVLVA